MTFSPTCRRHLLAAAGALPVVMLAGCGGVPLSALPRLARLPQLLLEADPAEFALALQMDMRMVPPPGEVPWLILQVRPSAGSRVEPLDRRLALQQAVARATPVGLAAAPAGRRWLLYTLPPATQVELSRLQALARTLRADAQGKGGGTLSVGIEQAALASPDPALAETRWDTWLQTRQADGFFEVWSGTLAQLRRSAPR